MSRRRRRLKRKKSIIPAFLLGMLIGGVVVAVAALAMSKTGLIPAGRNKTEQNAAQGETDGGPEAENGPSVAKEAQKTTEIETEKILQKAAGGEAERSSQETAGEETEGSSQEKTGPLVVIDAGHQGPGQDMSGTEPIGPGSQEMKARIVTGTQGTTTGLAEYELNLSVALLLQKELESRGYRVLMTRTTPDINISNIERADVANNAGADIMVRIHANGSEDSSVAGALTMIPSAANPYVGDMYDSCHSLAGCILNAYCYETGIANDGIMETDDMTGINWCQMPVTIVEMGFMTNPDDDLYMADEANQAVMATGIANGIDQYFGR